MGKNVVKLAGYLQQRGLLRQQQLCAGEVVRWGRKLYGFG